MGSKKAHLKPDAAKKAREKIRLEKKREEWRKGNEEEEKRRNKIREKVEKSRGAAERRGPKGPALQGLRPEGLQPSGRSGLGTRRSA
jgi:hypothetical protein